MNSQSRKTSHGPAADLVYRVAWILPLYRAMASESLRKHLRRWIVRWENGPAFSGSIRKLLQQDYGLEIGAYSYWPWREKPSVLHRGTRIGRYCWVADTVRTFTRNHPFNLLSSHGFFYNPELGKVSGPSLSFGSLEIAHGAWLGHGVIVVPPTRRIGIGAVVRPGSVVCVDVPDYAIVSGFPARVVAWRAPREEIQTLLATRWWEQTPPKLPHMQGSVPLVLEQS
ncbi:antibiotic acetyltransferase [Limisphaera sp. VF-2]|uniref:antibiotic acetyltransferase n=1 Tax=Limisphaera sp. VF-2 TaxID=3400418 RepID=UPI003095B3B6